nr:hypothetical protein [Glycomyces xiaoerkulensis]
MIEIDIAFRRVIAAHTGNPVLVGMIEALAGMTTHGLLTAWPGERITGALEPHECEDEVRPVNGGSVGTCRDHWLRRRRIGRRPARRSNRGVLLPD